MCRVNILSVVVLIALSQIGFAKDPDSKAKSSGGTLAQQNFKTVSNLLTVFDFHLSKYEEHRELLQSTSKFPKIHTRGTIFKHRNKPLRMRLSTIQQELSMLLKTQLPCEKHQEDLKTELWKAERHIGRFGQFVVMAEEVIGFEQAQENNKDFVTWGMKMIHAPKAWSAKNFSKPILVAVIDGGISQQHADLKPNLWINNVEFDGQDNVDDDGNGFKDDIHGPELNDDLHGSMMAGIIGAAHNEKGIAGVAKNVRLLMVPLDAFGNKQREAKAIKYALDQGAKIISISMQWSHYPELQAAVKKAEDQDVLIVNSAGNNGSDLDCHKTYPTSYAYSNILSVMSINKYGDPWKSYVNPKRTAFGKNSVHLAAPGEEIFSTGEANEYCVDENWVSGTSPATAFVAGAAALIWSDESYINLTAPQLRNVILQHVRKDSSLADKCITGGVLDLSFLSEKKAD